MSIRLVVISALLSAASAAPVLAACVSHDKQALSCAEGSAYDPQTGTCVPLTSS